LEQGTTVNSAPSEPLTVNGSALFQEAEAEVRIFNNGSDPAEWRLMSSSNAGATAAFRLYNNTRSSNDLWVAGSTNAGSRAGNVGINNTDPQGILHLDQGADSNGFILAYSGRGAQRFEYELSGTSNENAVFRQYNGTDTQLMFLMGRNGINFNEDGADQDFRVESDGNANAFFVDAGQDTVHIGGSGGNYVANIYANTVNSPTGTLYVNAALNNSGRGVFIDAATRNSSEDSTRLLQVRDRHAYNAFTINVGGAVEVNDDGGDWGDFRVESDNNSNMLLVDAGADRVIVGTNSSPAKFGPAIFQAGGFAIRTLGVGSSATSTGISVNAGGNGMTALVMTNRNTSAGTGTASGTYMLKFYYDGNNTPAVTHIAGDNFITFGQDGSNNLTMANPAAGNCNATLLMNG